MSNTRYYGGLLTLINVFSISATDMEPTDPNFIGAWWLGFGLIGIVVFALGLPMLFYPKHMTLRAAALARQHKNTAEAARQQGEEGSLQQKIKGDLKCSFIFTRCNKCNNSSLALSAHSLQDLLESHLALPFFSVCLPVFLSVCLAA